MDAKALKAYRRMALIRLEQLLVKQDENPCPCDYFVDKTIRVLSKMPALPTGAPPYGGLYGSGKTLDQYRDVATDRILELVEALAELDSVDNEIDAYIRELSDLPKRPEDAKPYVNLFVLRDESEDDEVETQTNPSPFTQQFVTSEQLIQIAGTGDRKLMERLTAFTPGVNATLEKFHINTKLRIAHFLAQVMHESGGFKWLREIWGPTDVQRRYEGRRDLGNTVAGDGKRFMGRGLVQLTGRANYQQFTNEVGKELGIDFVNNPELVEQSPHAVMVAGWYWNSRNLNTWADKDDLSKVTRRVNGGTNGIEDRRKYLKRAKAILHNSQFHIVSVPITFTSTGTGAMPMSLYDFCKAKLEYEPDLIAEDEKLAAHVQENLVRLGFLDPPADGKFGPISLKALVEFQETMSEKIPELAEEKGFLGDATAKALIETKSSDIPKPELKLGNDLASRIIKYMQQKNYVISTNLGEYNIVYVEGMDSDGNLNDDQPNSFNDLRMVIEFQNGKPKIVGCWDATTEPGKHYTYSPMNPKGAARIVFGQYKSWRVGTHIGKAEPHEALVQAGNIKVHRDFNKDFSRTGDKIDEGIFGVNQHYGYDLPRSNIGVASAGCLVGRTRQGHRQFMTIIKKDKRYRQNRSYLFLTTVIPGDELET